MPQFALTRALSYDGRAANEYHCFCMDCDDGDNDINKVSKFVRLGCRCVLHYHCLIQYVRSKLGDRLTMALRGISCPYGGECKSFKSLDDVHGDEALIYYITTDDLDNIVDYGSNHPDLKKPLKDSECKELTHEEVNGLRQWIEEQQQHQQQLIEVPDIDDLFINSTTKACPSCGYRSTHYHGHQCHHISHARPPQRGGCPNCHTNYCYKCLSTELENILYRGSKSSCRCGYWSSFCGNIQSASDIKSYLSINEGGIPYDTRCGCVICSDCRYGTPCSFCHGYCSVCRGYLNPSPSECTDAKNGASKWIAEGPMLRIECNMVVNLWDYCRYNYFEKLAVLLQSEEMTIEALNRQDRSGKTALHLACSANHIECVQLLLSQVGIDVNIANRIGETPLYEAGRCRGSIECARMLLAHDDIDPNKTGRDCRTPLHRACLTQNMEYAQVLLSHSRIDPNKVTTVTALQYVCLMPNIECARMLLSHSRIDPNKRTKDCFMTPLHIACRDNRISLVRVLLAHGRIDTNRADRDGQTPICYTGRLEIVRMILSREPNSNGIIPLLVAILRVRPKVIVILFNHQQGYTKCFYLLFCYCLLVAVAYCGREGYDIITSSSTSV